MSSSVEIPSGAGSAKIRHRSEILRTGIANLPPCLSQGHGSVRFKDPCRPETIEDLL
ncbi:hypothetical protein J6590_019809 [Homalodisca vitripennis]|nr:hypothetical protein J6590_019809 [Homalodisca vitripennis]